MQINRIDNTKFTARNATIRRADDIARLVNNAFPRISPTKFEHIKNKGITLWNLEEKLRNQRGKTNFAIMISNTLIDKISSLLEPIKKNHIGNCAESAELAILTAKANGIKNIKAVNMFSNKNNDLDHVVAYVADKKPYVIDAWLGFADYIPEAIKRWQSEYRYLFDFKPNDKVVFVDNNSYVTENIFEKEFSEEDLKNIKEMYPELFLGNKKQKK